MIAWSTTNSFIGFIHSLGAITCISFSPLPYFSAPPSSSRPYNRTPGAASASLAANQGLYNGFLAAGLIWGLAINDPAVKTFFLICVVIAGVYGGITAKRSILYMQALPGLLGLIFLFLSR